MRDRRALTIAWLVLCALLLSSNAFAHRVLLVRPTASDDLLSEALSRLRAELSVQGFETLVVELAADQATPSRLSDLAKQQGAFAGISLARRSGEATAEVCIADRITGKTSLRTLAIGSDSDAPNVLAVRAADLLRSSLQEFTSDEKPPPDVVGVDPEPAPRFKTPGKGERRSSLRLDARVAALGLGQRIGPGYGPSLAFSYRAFDRIWVGARVDGPALGAIYTTSSGSALLVQELALARISGVVYRSERFEIRSALATGVYHFDARGQVEPPNLAQSAGVTTFAGGLGLEADLRLSRTFLVGVEVSGLLVTPRPGVAVLDERYLFRWPLVTASLGIGVEL